MTNKTVTMSRELAERISARLERLNAGFCELRALLAAPVVERQEAVGIEGMPQYLILFDDTERPVETMFGEQIARKRYADISMSWNAHLFVKIDSNSRDAMFAKNNATVHTSPPELAELQAELARYKSLFEQAQKAIDRVNALHQKKMASTFKELTAEIERLKGWQGEAVAWFTEDHLTDKSATTYDVGVSVMWGVKGWPVTPLYASPPAPVTVVLDDRAAFEKWIVDEWPLAPLRYVRDALPEDDPLYGTYCDEYLQRAWVGWQARACLDKVKELNPQ